MQRLAPLRCRAHQMPATELLLGLGRTDPSCATDQLRYINIFVRMLSNWRSTGVLFHTRHRAFACARVSVTTGMNPDPKLFAAAHTATSRALLTRARFVNNAQPIRARYERTMLSLPGLGRQAASGALASDTRSSLDTESKTSTSSPVDDPSVTCSKSRSKASRMRWPAGPMSSLGGSGSRYSCVHLVPHPPARCHPVVPKSKRPEGHERSVLLCVFSGRSWFFIFPSSFTTTWGRPHLQLSRRIHIEHVGSVGASGETRRLGLENFQWCLHGEHRERPPSTQQHAQGS